MGGLTLNVSPAVATVDSFAKPPGDQQQFTAASGYTLSSKSGSCATPALLQLVHPVWSSSAPLHISISSADDATNGLATCNGATSGPVTLTATSGSGKSAITATATLTCH